MPKVSISDAVGRAQARLAEQQAGHTARAAAELAEMEGGCTQVALHPAQQRVLDSRRRMAAATWRPTKARLDGEPTQERECHSSQGFDREYLAKPSGSYPGRVVSKERSPMMMPEEIAEAISVMRRDLENKGINVSDLPEGVRIKSGGILDEALSNEERDALAKFVRDVLITNVGAKIANYGQYRHEFASMARKTLASDRIKFVIDIMPPSYEEWFDMFIEHMLKLRGIEIKPPKELGKILTASKDDRVGRGGYIGAMVMLSRWLCYQYVMFDIDRDRRRRGLIGEIMTITAQAR